MYELYYGSIFDKKCDIIVIPCNNFGGVSNGILKEFTKYNIPKVTFMNHPGDILFSENIGSFTNAAIIAFASSVSTSPKKTEDKYLAKICDEIILYCQINSLSIINIPLLGTGAGNLSYQESFKVLKEHFENADGITLRIFTLSQEFYFEFKQKNDYVIHNPRVFISYTGEDPENRKWVKSFVCKLRENGVNARVDIFNLKLGTDLPQWMTNELCMADKVILICDEYYVKKADSRNGGVGWETMIIQGDMMMNPQLNKYICIVRKGKIDDGIPIYAKTKFSLHCTESEIAEADFKELLYCLFDIDIEPNIGDIPTYIKNKMQKA